nr:hypothetical protein [Tanacetum cinerariifolium]
MQHSSVDSEGYPVYGRRDDGKYMENSGHHLHNDFVIPYNATLSKHRVSVELYEPAMTVDGEHIQKPVDEIKAYLDCRYLYACEAAWRLFGFEVQYRTLSIEKQGKSIGRIHNVPISTGDAFYCRMLLNNAKGCRTHDGIKKVNGVVYPTYKEACYAAGLLEDDKEYIECIEDTAYWATVKHLCELFVTLLSQKELTMPLSVWLQTWHLLAGDVQFKRRQILKRLFGDGQLGEANDGEVSIDVPEELLIDAVDDPVTSIIDFNYPNLLNNINNPSYFQEKAILAPTNEVMDTINDHLLNKFPGEEMVHLSCDSIDKIERGSAIDEAIFSSEFINGLKFSGVPNHKLALKMGVPITLLRNIDQANGLCNGTRLQALRLTRTSIKAKIINGTHFGKEVIIP